MAQQLEDLLKEVTEKDPPPPIMNGAYGDMEDCAGVVEAVLTPETGGTFIKLYGCSKLFKGYPDNTLVEGLALGKAFISMIPRKIISASLTLQLGLLVLFLFARKRFYHYLHIYAHTLWFNTVAKLSYDPFRFSTVSNELRRAVYAALSKRIDTSKSLLRNLTPEELDTPKDGELWEAVACVMEFVYIFIEVDCAYRFRLQDILSMLDKDKLRENPTGEIERLFDILVSRENSQKHKWEDLRRILIPFLSISKTAREFLADFLMELDLTKIQYDADDWYFVLKRDNYNYGGLSIQDRLEIKKDVDEILGHTPVIVQSS